VVRRHYYLAKLEWDPAMQGKWISRTQEMLKKLESQDSKQALDHRNKIRGGWADLAGGRTFTIYEYDPAEAESDNPWYGSFAWNDIATVELIPVITVGHLMDILKNKDNPNLKR
jgi:hypothetical protein